MARKNFRATMCMMLTITLVLCCAMPAFAHTNGYSVNENGETYGNNLQAMELGYLSDLLLAEGENGVMGYIRASDLDDAVMRPEEAVNSSADSYIPLYESDGVTIIGRFRIAGVPEDIPQTFSSYTYGNKGVMSPPGYTGYSKSGVKGSVGGVTGTTEVTTSKEVAISWIGIQACVYKSSTGAVVASSSWEYNTSATNSFSREVYHFSVLDETYYSQGRVKMWNSDISGYWTYSTYASPVVKPST